MWKEETKASLKNFKSKYPECKYKKPNKRDLAKY
jgi:hypothetical protein